MPPEILDNSPKRRCIAYIDGYNWYHSVFKHHPEWKWLNIHGFFHAMRPRENVIAAKIFSALINDQDARERQQRYFKALSANPKNQVILGKFQERHVTCRGSCGEVYAIQEEKKTDVNMAVEMMSDAVDGNCEHMCIVTADSDIQPAVEWIAHRFSNIQLTVYVPALPNEQVARRTDYYKTKGLRVECAFLPLHKLKDYQLPGCVKLADGTFAIRPTSWAAPVAPAA
jgi:6-hydroxy-3-succinoylpyridine 3-monooxygenase